MIDYEFASNNERTYELSALSAEMFYEEDTGMGLVERHFGSARRDMFARVIVNRALADFKWACWAVLNRRLSGLDFDYQKYRIWKYMRARDHGRPSLGELALDDLRCNAPVRYCLLVADVEIRSFNTYIARPVI